MATIFIRDASLMRRGNQLRPEDQREVLNRFVHRFTGSHIPQWARKPLPDGRYYPVQFLNDEDWLANTDFAVDGAGRLDSRVCDCWSHPTYPRGRGYPTRVERLS